MRTACFKSARAFGRRGSANGLTHLRLIKPIVYFSAVRHNRAGAAASSNQVTFRDYNAGAGILESLRLSRIPAIRK